MRTPLPLIWLVLAACLAAPALADGSGPAVPAEAGPLATAGQIAMAPALLSEGPSACSTSGGDGLYNVPDRAFCSAECGSGAPNVSCSGPGVCQATDRNCAIGEPGHVTCGATTTSCPDCECTNGQVRYVSSSQCCCDYTIDWAPVNRRKLIEERCVDGYWVYAGFSCSGQNCGGVCEL